MFGKLKESKENCKTFQADTAQQAQDTSVPVRDRPGNWQLASTYRGALSARSSILKNKMQHTKLRAATAEEGGQAAP